MATSSIAGKRMIHNLSPTAATSTPDRRSRLCTVIPHRRMYLSGALAFNVLDEMATGLSASPLMALCSNRASYTSIPTLIHHVVIDQDTLTTSRAGHPDLEHLVAARETSLLASPNGYTRPSRFLSTFPRCAQVDTSDVASQMVEAMAIEGPPAMRAHCPGSFSRLW